MLKFHIIHCERGGYLLGIKIEKLNENLIINWQLSKIEILIKDINDVFLDPNYGGEEKRAVRIGFPYGSTTG